VDAWQRRRGTAAGEGDDRAVARGAQGGQAHRHRKPGAVEIDLDGVQELLGRVVVRAPDGGEDAGCRDDAVQRAPDVVDGRVPRRLDGHVEHDAAVPVAGQVGQRRLHRLLAAGGDDDLGARIGGGERDLAPDALRAAGDQDASTLQRHAAHWYSVPEQPPNSKSNSSSGASARAMARRVSAGLVAYTSRNPPPPAPTSFAPMQPDMRASR
jgi:hypothetical protein